MNTLWAKQEKTEPLEKDLAALVNEFTSGIDRRFDLLLAKYDVKGSLAHAEMLCKTGLLTVSEWKLIQSALQHILSEIGNGEFQIQENVEDIHSQIELLLTERIGDAGKKIHSARSRNDQALLDIKLFLRDELWQVTQETGKLFELLLERSEKHKQDLLPGYTHFQLAMPSSFGLWFAAYAESFTDDMEMLIAAYNVCNKNPLGSAAGFGSSFPVDRSFTTDLLDFPEMNVNAVYVQMTRGKTEKIVAMALSNFAATLSKQAYDCCLFMSQENAFISFPSSLVTGSSIMPHKKNPDVFELIRAKCNRIQALPNELTLLTNNLPSGYHRDFQLTKEILFPAITELKSCLTMMTLMMRHIIVKENMLASSKYDLLFSVEEVNRKVVNGIPFREAYRQTAKEIAEGNYFPEKKLSHTHEGSLGNLCNEMIKAKFDTLVKKVSAHTL